MKILKICMLSILATTMFVSCEKQTDVDQSPETVAEETQVKDIEYVMKNDVEGTEEKGILMGGDVFISYAHLKELEKSSDDPQKLRIERNRVNMCQGPRHGGGKKRRITINVSRLNSRARAATKSAADFFNGQNLGIQFGILTGSYPGVAGSRITCYTKNLGGDFAEATFPKGGNPGPTIQVGKRFADRKSFNEIRRLMIHEIAHCLGFRHSDWNGRSSCPRNDRGVENVQNTFFAFNRFDNGKNTNSIMAACGDLNIDPTSTDRQAISRAYPSWAVANCR